MPSHVVFLRAVNVGKRQVRMADLRTWLAEEGFTAVETYIQTGNVRVSTPMRSRAKVEQRLESMLAQRCGFEVPCIALSPAELVQVHVDARALKSPSGAAEGRRYVVFLKTALSAEVTEQMAAYDPPGERIWAVGRAAHVWIADDFHAAKVFGAFKKALAEGTVRDVKVVATLAQKWSR
jgi:uncharacterized protein (DUF1697 family)